MENDYPLADTAAARMLAEGLARAKDERGLSIRQIGKQMNYKTSVVLSHMASGRVPIPIDRSEEMAKLLKLDRQSFILAVLRQRHPDVRWAQFFESEATHGADGLAMELEVILGARLQDLDREQRAVMREVAAERSPRRRWLSVHELRAVEVLRDIYPNMPTDGMMPGELKQLRDALRNRRKRE